MKVIPDQICVQSSLEFENPKWPNQEIFPLNIPDLNRKVGDILEQDLKNSGECTIITGFTSLARIVEWFGTDKFQNLRSARILLGNDPILRKRAKYPYSFMELDLKEYWLNKRISLYLGSSVLNIIDKLQSGRVTIRFKDRAHAKIYVGDHHAILGSSNFSKSGLEQQLEANIRESKDGQYDSLKQLANLFYYEGIDYKEQLISLLKELLADVTWEESLARAISEVLEGRWFADQNDFFQSLENKKFWPSQYSGLIEAINILIEKGNVLIADPTGSGKTKMCAAVMVSFIYWLWQKGEKYRSNLLLFSPPVVSNNWKQEFADLSFLNCTLRSLGILSNTSDSNLKDILKELEIADVLAVDEAHNLLNPLSNRSKKISKNEASYNILITATPVNKRLEDLVRIIELLDIDNLNDNDFHHFKAIKENKKATKEDIERLKGFIDQFLVRRTKEDLNNLIDKEPDKYRNKTGNTCRFPKVKDVSYQTKETKEDRALVDKINKLASKLRGLNFLKSFEPPVYLIRNEKDQQTYIKQRLTGSKSLSIYMIRSRLRSSKLALLEYIKGTSYVKEEFNIESSKNATGNVIETVQSLMGDLPGRKDLNDEFFPDWLTDQKRYDQACEEEIDIYDQITNLTNQLSLRREKGKINEVLQLLLSHNIVIAFDSNLITLDLFAKMVREEDNTIHAYLATGSNSSIVEKVLKVCAHETKHTNTVIFCSDMMSEGVNLQGASSLILLDLPSVIRLVEQRIGRIDRMDTDHESIEVLWPNDSEQYSLKGDQRLIETSAFVDATLGGNFTIPADLRGKHFAEVESIEDIQRELSEHKGDTGWEGSHNFFKPIERLKEKFIPKEVYEHICDVHAQIKTRVSFYESSSTWCFICTRGSMNTSPKWIYLEKNGKLLSDFISVANALSEKLPFIEKQRLEWDQGILDVFLKEFRRNEKVVLSEKLKRCLDVAHYLLLRYTERKTISKKLKALVDQNIRLFDISISEDIVDYSSLAKLWLEILQPPLDSLRAKRNNRRRALNLNVLREHWKLVKLDDQMLKRILTKCETTSSIDNRIAACIIGVQKI